MRLGRLAFSFCLAAACFAQGPNPDDLRGTLLVRPGKPPAIQTADHRVVTLEADAQTLSVLGDRRLDGFDLEVKGRPLAPDRFLVDPFHTRSMFVRRDGRLKVITYWCDTCSIRTYTPGPCWCCQKETILDLRDPDQDR